jgi:hypothetical protein
MVQHDDRNRNISNNWNSFIEEIRRYMDEHGLEYLLVDLGDRKYVIKKDW